MGCYVINAIHKKGIPQGSIIVEPLFFSIYINDIVKCTEKN